MIIAWFIFIIFVIIFSVVGSIGIMHGNKYKLENDLTDFAIRLYIFFMVSIIIFTVVLVILNGPNAKIELPAIKNLR